ncbi:MAG TPA: UDP-N-acetylmuramoyl-L-alanyl-D-glutamate--2,6-diaminopimelate ligase [Microbacterium sp.]|nr:UDP-N-acetylmuramoyl-L-alanyl-D-glutamate--2,6-diaminopimelate ligase [Microbacterium sp.]
MKVNNAPVLRPEHPEPRSLFEFATRFPVTTIGDITGLTAIGATVSSVDVRPGELFIALHGVPRQGPQFGARRHGAEYAAQAVANGAVAIVTDTMGLALARDCGLPIFVMDDPRPRVSEFASWAFGNDGRMPVMLGVTGTNGKTSTVHLQHEILNALGRTNALSSSARRIVADTEVTAKLSTPEASEVHAILAYGREQGVEVMCLEVSVQAIIHGRSAGLVFDVAGFTNLQLDHREDFANMDDYLAAKTTMFQGGTARKAVVSLDTVAGRTVADKADCPVTTVATPEIAEDRELAESAQWIARMTAERVNATAFTLDGPGGQHVATTVPALGAHMVTNAALAIVMLVEAGIPWDEIAGAIDGRIPGFLPGRTQPVTTGRGPVVYIDFAHTPDAIEVTAAAVRRVTPGKVIVIFGADGSRDGTKRPIMGRAASRNSDVAIVSDYNPRWEDPDVIRAQLYEGAIEDPPTGGVFNIADPEEALDKAMSLAEDGDAILWCGPGHQDFLDVRGQRVAYDFPQISLDALHRYGWD